MNSSLRNLFAYKGGYLRNGKLIPIDPYKKPTEEVYLLNIFKTIFKWLKSKLQ